MAGKTAILSLKILGDATGAQKAAAKTKTEISALEKAMGGIQKAAKWAGAAAGGALALGLDSALAADSANRVTAAALGLDPAEMETAGRISGDLYKNGYGESMEQVSETIKGVGSTLADMSANGGADVERLTKKALDMATAFPEVGDGVATAGILIHTGLAKSADEAYDLMVGSMQKMPAAMQAELMPVMDEYSTHFAALGIDGETAFGIMTQAANNGAIGMDKAGDALKELTIRATDGSATTVAAYEAMGLSNDDMTAKMLAGGADAQDAFGQIVAGLQTMEDPAAQSAAALALFGTPLEDLGVSQIPAFLGAIDPMGDAFDSTAGAATAMGETLNSGPGVALETFKRTAMDALTQLGTQALPMLQPILDILIQYAPIIAPVVLALAGFAAIIGTVTAAMTVWTTVQTVLNAVMAANPIMLVVLAVLALIAGVVLAYQNIGWFKDAVNMAGQIATAVFSTIVGWVSSVIDWLVNVIGQSATFQAGIDLLGTAFTVAGEIGVAIFEAISTGVTTTIDWVKSVTTESETFQNLLSGLGEIGASVFGAIDTAISTTIGWVKDAVTWFGSLFSAKNDAASADAGAGAAAAMAAPMAMLSAPMAAMASAVGPSAYDTLDSFGNEYGVAAYSGPSAAREAGPAAALVSSIERAGAARSAGVTNHFTIEVKADATTDRAALGRELLDTINHGLRSAGYKKLASV